MKINEIRTKKFNNIDDDIKLFVHNLRLFCSKLECLLDKAVKDYEGKTLAYYES
jgi:hypothetical protein